MSVFSPLSRVPLALAAARPPHERPTRSRAEPPVPVAALGDIAAGLAHIQRSVPLADEDPDEPRSLRLIATADYDVWLITWPPGSELAKHDHADATSVIRLVHGSLVEVVGGQHRVLGPGISVVTPPHTPHHLHNRSAAPATSLHVYSPPLSAVTYLDPGPGRTMHPARGGSGLGATPIRLRRAEATSEGDSTPS